MLRRARSARLEGLETTLARLVQPERRQAPPRLALGEAECAYVGQRVVRRGAEVDRRLAAAGGRGPAGAQELLAGRDQVVRPGAHPFGVDDQHPAVGRHQVEEQLHLVHQGRSQ